MEAGADLQQRADAAVELGAAGGRLRDPREDLQQGALAGAVAADDADDLAALDLEGDVLEGPERVRFAGARRRRRSVVRASTICSRSDPYRFATR